MKTGRVLLVAMLALLVAGPVAAGSFRVDDSASEVLGSTVPMRWDSATPRNGQRQTMSGTVAVVVRLDVEPWAGRQGRIFLNLPAQPAGPMTVTWATHGRLLSGTVRGGERTLVYAGPIPAGMIEDTLRLLIEVDGRRLVRPEQLDFAFEIDVE